MSFSASHPWTWVAGREVGHHRRRHQVGAGRSRRGCIGDLDHLHKELYRSITETGSWDPFIVAKDFDHGAVFNFDFAKDGSLLVAACERKSLLLFDPLSHKHIQSVHNAHSDCINFVRFLDTRVFATCSDDTSVALWDVRYLKSRMRTLHGHSNWVKNIEYAQDKGLLVTSGFDGSIYAWNINSYSEDESTCFQRVFHMGGLMRMKLTPDADKLVVATAGGYLMVIHDLDLRSVSSDLHSFKPNMYRLMQRSQSPIRQGYAFNHLFNKRRKRNRVELISDFPAANEAEVIASLQVHPNGRFALSRNTSSDDDSEWTCVHRIDSEEEESQESDDADRCPNCGKRYFDAIPDQNSHEMEMEIFPPFEDAALRRGSVEEATIVPLSSPTRDNIPGRRVRSSSLSSSSSSSSSSSLVDFRDRSPLMSGSSEISPVPTSGAARNSLLGAARSSPLNLPSVAPEIPPAVRQRRFLSFAVESGFSVVENASSSSSRLSTTAASSTTTTTTTSSAFPIATSSLPSRPRYGSSRASGRVVDLSDDDNDDDVNTEMLERYLRPPIPSGRRSLLRSASRENSENAGLEGADSRQIVDPVSMFLAASSSEAPASPTSSTRSTIGTRSSMDDDPMPMESSALVDTTAAASSTAASLTAASSIASASSSLTALSEDAIPMDSAVGDDPSPSLMPEIVVIPETGGGRNIARIRSVGDDDDEDDDIEDNNVDDDDDEDANVGHDSSATETASNSESNDRWDRSSAAQVFLSSSNLSSLGGISTLDTTSSGLPIRGSHRSSSQRSSHASQRRFTRSSPRVVVRRVNGQRLTVIRRDRTSQNLDHHHRHSLYSPRSNSQASDQRNSSLRSMAEPTNNLSLGRSPSDGQAADQASFIQNPNDEGSLDNDRASSLAAFPSAEAASSSDAASSTTADAAAGPSPTHVSSRTRTFHIRSGVQPPARTVLLLNRHADDDLSDTMDPDIPYSMSMRGSSSRVGDFSSSLCTCVDSMTADGSGGGGGTSQKLIHANKPRLAFFEEESNIGKGFIKELCFSSDGRLVCSPFGFGVRLMSFNEACSDLTDIPGLGAVSSVNGAVSSASSLGAHHPPVARPLRSVSTIASHSNTVVCTKWSPTHCLFASACLNGKVVFYNPVL